MNKLKELRKKRNLTLDQIEKETGINRATFSRYENGKSEPNVFRWIRLANYFDVSLDYLMGRLENECPTKKDVSAATDNVLE